MPQFHETGYGRTFFEHTLPNLSKQLERIANALEEQNKDKSINTLRQGPPVGSLEDLEFKHQSRSKY